MQVWERDRGRRGSGGEGEEEERDGISRITKTKKTTRHSLRTDDTTQPAPLGRDMRGRPEWARQRGRHREIKGGSKEGKEEGRLE